MIECLKCGRKMKMITQQHLKKCSGITLDEYKIEFPNTKVISDKLKEYRIENCKNLMGKKKKVNCYICGIEVETPVVNNWKVKCEKCSKPKLFENQIYLKNEDKVVCQICWKPLDQITVTHMKLHKISLEEYREKFPDSILTNKKIRDQRRKRHTGERNPAKRDNVRKRMSQSQRKGIKYYEVMYPFFTAVEKLRENKDGKIEVQCKWCKKWFVPSSSVLYERTRALETPKGNDGSYFYCSDECRGECPLYRMQPSNIINEKNNEQLDEENYRIWRNEVIKRQKEELGYNECELCQNKNINELSVHHEKPRKTHPHLTYDPDNGVILCGVKSKNKCHYKIGHTEKCSTGYLSSLICEKKYNK
jgi:hypothetical protein